MVLGHRCWGLAGPSGSPQMVGRRRRLEVSDQPSPNVAGGITPRQIVPHGDGTGPEVLWEEVPLALPSKLH